MCVCASDNWGTVRHVKNIFARKMVSQEHLILIKNSCIFTLDVFAVKYSHICGISMKYAEIWLQYIFLLDVAHHPNWHLHKL